MSTTEDCLDVRDHVSSQQSVIRDDDPTPQNTHDYHPNHMHHNSRAEKSPEDEVIYSYDTTYKRSTFPHQDPQDHDLNRRRHSDTAKELRAVADPEQGTGHSEEDAQTRTFSRFYRRYRIFFHLLFALFFTGWWIAGLILHGIHDPLSSNTGWLKPFLLWLGITLRFVFFHVRITVLTKPVRWAWEATSVLFAQLLPDQVKIPLAALLTVSVFLIGGFVSPESEDNTRDNRAVCTYFPELMSPLLNMRSIFETCLARKYSSDVFQGLQYFLRRARLTLISCISPVRSSCLHIGPLCNFTQPQGC